jgi:hypothetical protein
MHLIIILISYYSKIAFSVSFPIIIQNLITIILRKWKLGASHTWQTLNFIRISQSIYPGLPFTFSGKGGL